LPFYLSVRIADPVPDPDPVLQKLQIRNLFGVNKCLEDIERHAVYILNIQFTNKFLRPLLREKKFFKLLEVDNFESWIRIGTKNAKICNTAADKYGYQSMMEKPKMSLK
jgi:hypothetical protein